MIKQVRSIDLVHKVEQCIGHTFFYGKELDENYDNETTYDELYGKGAWAKDMAIMSTYWKVTDRFMLTKNKKLSSK